MPLHAAAEEDSHIRQRHQERSWFSWGMFSFRFKKLMQQCFAQQDDFTVDVVDDELQSANIDKKTDVIIVEEEIRTTKNLNQVQPETAITCESDNSIVSKSKLEYIDDKNSATTIAPNHGEILEVQAPPVREQKSDAFAKLELLDEEGHGSTSGYVEIEVNETEVSQNQSVIDTKASGSPVRAKNMNKSNSIFVKQNQIVSPLLAAIRLLEIIEEHKVSQSIIKYLKLWLERLCFRLRYIRLITADLGAIYIFGRHFIDTVIYSDGISVI